MLSKFLNTKTLIILLVVLGGIFLVTKLTEKEDRTFRSELVSIDTSKVTKMVIIPKAGAGPNIAFTRSGSDWSLESEGKSYTPDESSINNILVELTRMRTERVAAIDESKWDEFEVTDSTASRIQLYSGEDVLADLYLGKFTYTQAPQTNPNQQRQQTRMFTHVRPVDDPTVYVVEGFIKMNVQPNVNTYRAKILCAMEQEDITKISFNYPDSEKFVLQSQEGKWYLNGEETDSTKTARYLMKFKRLTNNSFVDEPLTVSDSPSHTVVLEGNNTLPVELRAYPTTDSTHQYLITSSLIPDARYSGYKSRLFEKVFVPEDEFFATKEE